MAFKKMMIRGILPHVILIPPIPHLKRLTQTLHGQDMLSESPKPMPTPQEPSIPEPKPPPNPKPRNPRLPTGGDYGPENLRRSTRIRK